VTNIIRAINDPAVFGRYFRAESWTAWRVFLAALFGLPLVYDQKLLFERYTGRKVAPSSPLQEAWLVVGRRGGKSFVLAVIAVFLACFRDWKPYLGPGEVGTIMIIAKDRAQARHIKRFVSGVLRDTPMLAPMIEDETAEEIRLKNRVAIEIHTASFRSTRGYTIVAALLDEIAFWESDETSANPDVEVVNAIKPGMATVPGAMLLCASSPHGRHGVLWKAYKKHFGKDNDPVLVWQAPTRAMNPSVPQSYIDAHMGDDPALARAEYFAEFRANVAGFITQAVVDAAVVPNRLELPYVEGVHYIGAVDPSGGSNDPMTLSLVHTERGADGTRRGIVDLVREVKPPFSPDAVVAEFAQILKSYGITTVWGDRYGGVWPRERFAVHGINYQVLDKPASDLYKELLPALNSQRVELLDDACLIEQLLQLERHVGTGGKDTIQHPAGGHDDVINAVAAALVKAFNAPQELETFPMPFVAGTPRYFPGSDEFTGAGAPTSLSVPATSYDYSRNDSWKAYVNTDGSIRSTPRTRWDF